ncbi:hypothetical protein DM47_4791 [Burkholderia mallei]|nr:hypothetical protein DM49_4851 [Burkholderia mallei]KOT15911.1 hypothetical protein DM47_4791 [Burkholderia mallei]
MSDSTNVSGTIVSHSAKMFGVASPVASAEKKPITLHASISLCLYLSGPGMSTTHAPSAPVAIVKPSSRSCSTARLSTAGSDTPSAIRRPPKKYWL